VSPLAEHVLISPVSVLTLGHAGLSRNRRSGFTLVELLVVIAIIGILATLLILQLNTARGKARDTKRIGDINQLRTAIELYYDANNAYPADISDANIGKYMGSSKAPLDPQGGAYHYATVAGKYQVAAYLENLNAGAFATDTDISSTDWATTINGTAEACTGLADRSDCVFDLGIK
jgi:prepilin-type N-terminal cleavage/methylation domain-containing protein